MQFYTKEHKHVCGIDLHARSLYICVVNEQKETVLHKNIRAEPEVLLRALGPYKEDLVIACECTFSWYWLADLCADHNITFILGHALYMKAIHGSKTKSDKIDSMKIALLVRAGMFPVAYVYPKRIRATRDLLRELELSVLHSARQHAPRHLNLLQTVPGIGKILALNILYEIGDISRFNRVQDFVSYCRLIRPEKSSGGKIVGFGERKIGNAHLRWSFGEAAAGFPRKNPPGQQIVDKLK